MKRIVCSLCFLAICLAISGKPRTKSEMKEIARSTLSNSSRKNVNRKPQTLSTQQLEIVEEMDGISIVADKETGFVIISNDDEQTPVLGYSFSPYEDDNQPEGFLWWKQAINDAMKKKPLKSKSFVPSEFKPSVEPFIKTHWHQNSPFNNKCPMLNGRHCVTGCVATALAQVLYYYRYPLHGIDSYGGFNYGETLFEWGNMQYDYESFTSVIQQDAVATLMYACGVSVDTSYGLGASSAGFAVYDALKDTFGYENPKRSWRNSSSVDWMSTIYNELSNGRPVLYNGYDDSSSGHAFILHGYDLEGRVYINYGWGGYKDGYYNIDALEFPYDQSMVYNLRNFTPSPYLMNNGSTITGTRAANTTHTVTVNITNHGTDYIGPLYFWVSQGLSKPETCLSYKNVRIGAEQTVDVSFYYTPNANGEYYLWVTEDNSGKDIVGKVFLEIATDKFITFEDNIAYRYCISHYDTDHDGAISYNEAAAVTRLESVDQAITSFDELKYFTSLTTIDSRTFGNCSELRSITLPYSITTIRTGAFSGCKSLPAVTIPSSVTSIGVAAFYNCTTLHQIDIPESVIDIGESAFYGCTSLESVIISSNSKLEVIGSTAFYNCSALSSFSIPDGIKTLEREAFYKCSSLKSVTIPQSVESIGDATFSGCINLTSITIPKGVTSIGQRAFYDCKSLTSVTIDISTPLEINGATFSNRQNATLYVPEGCVDAYKAAEYWKEFKFIVESGTEPQTDAVTLKAKSYTREYGEANPTFGYEVTEGAITSGTPTITCAATQTSPVGTYDIVINEGSVSNGTVNLVNGKLIITKAPLTISAGNYTKQEGEANPTFTPTFSGFKNSETKAVLTTQPTITTTATTSSPAGTYPVTVSGAAAQNYDISYVNGTLTVTAKPVDNANTFEPDCFWPDMSENVDKIEFIVIGFPKELGHFSADKLKLLDNEGTQVRTLQARWLDDGEYVEGAPFYKADKDIYQFVKFVFSSENTAAVKATGIYQFTVPEGYVWNDKYNDSDDDKGISAGARYNPEFTITYHVIEDVPVVKENIEFADAKVKEICIANWDRNNDGELSKEEAAMVTSLANKFNYNKEITSFDELQYFTGLSSIGRDFYGCKNLLSVTLPTSLTSISTAAFSFCESLRKIHIPEKVNSIGFNPFSSCTNLEEMTVATNNPYFDSRNGCNAIIKKDNNELISGCKTSVIPEGIVNINYGAFLYISTLTSINIPASVKCISYADGWHGDDGTNPFIYCSGLTSITVADGNPVYDSRDNCNAVIETSTNTLRVGCKATMIPNSVKIIGSMAFEGSGVTRVDIPNSIEEVKSAAFMDCKSLTEVTLSSSINTIWQHAFGECTNLQKVTSNIFDPFELDYLTFSPKVPVLYVPKGRKAAYEAAGWAQYFSKIIEMDEDGIDEMDNGQWTMDNVVIYNLSGQRLSKPQRGVNIINGKKIVVK